MVIERDYSPGVAQDLTQRWQELAPADQRSARMARWFLFLVGAAVGEAQAQESQSPGGENAKRLRELVSVLLPAKTGPAASGKAADTPIAVAFDGLPLASPISAEVYADGGGGEFRFRSVAKCKRDPDFFAVTVADYKGAKAALAAGYPKIAAKGLMGLAVQWRDGGHVTLEEDAAAASEQAGHLIEAALMHADLLRCSTLPDFVDAAKRARDHLRRLAPQLLLTDPKAARARIRSGVEAVKNFDPKSWRLAARDLRFGLALEPKNVAGHFYLAEALRRVPEEDDYAKSFDPGFLQQAAPHYRLVMELAPNSKVAVLTREYLGEGVGAQAAAVKAQIAETARGREGREVDTGETEAHEAFARTVAPGTTLNDARERISEALKARDTDAELAWKRWAAHQGDAGAALDLYYLYGKMEQSEDWDIKPSKFTYVACKWLRRAIEADKTRPYHALARLHAKDSHYMACPGFEEDLALALCYKKRSVEQQRQQLAQYPESLRRTLASLGTGSDHYLVELRKKMIAAGGDPAAALGTCQ